MDRNRLDITTTKITNKLPVKKNEMKNKQWKTKEQQKQQKYQE